MTNLDMVLLVLAGAAVATFIVALVFSPKARNWILLTAGGILGLAAMYCLGRLQDEEEDDEPSKPAPVEPTPPKHNPRLRIVDVDRARDAEADVRISDDASRLERLERIAGRGED